MMQRFVVMILLIALGNISFAQKVENKAFAQRLKSLLDHNVKEISVKDAKAIQSKITFLDAREINEYRISHIKKRDILNGESAIQHLG